MVLYLVIQVREIDPQCPPDHCAMPSVREVVVCRRENGRQAEAAEVADGQPCSYGREQMVHDVPAMRWFCLSTDRFTWYRPYMNPTSS
jgi:hypothetical protein